eukprot:SAG31_NODE_7318_length_1720_cov_2.404688_4_plen_147_part_01
MSTGGTKSSGAAADGKSGVSEVSKKISGCAAGCTKNALEVSKQSSVCTARCGDQFDIRSLTPSVFFSVNQPISLTSDFHINQTLIGDAKSFAIDAVRREINGDLFNQENTLHASNVTTDDNSINCSTQICNQSRLGWFSDVGDLGEP